MAQLNTTAVRLTPLAALIDHALGGRGGSALGTDLALSRMPGTGWETYDAIAERLSTVVDRRLNRVTIKTFAEDVFGIPDTRYVDVNGRSVAMPKQVGAEPISAYISEIQAAAEFGDRTLAKVIDQAKLVSQADILVAAYLDAQNEATNAAEDEQEAPAGVNS